MPRNKFELLPARRFGIIITWLVLILISEFRAGINAATFWTGPNTNYVQTSSDPVDVLIPGAVSFTRYFSQWLLNPDGGDPGPGPGTPSDTLWAFGTLDNYSALTYHTFDWYRNGNLSLVLVGNPMVVYLTNENIYLSLTFTEWTQNGGPFAYTRSTPLVVAPTVTITNPVSGSVFAAPAIVKISASASVNSGSVTNVAFFSNSNPVGSVQTAPFNLTISNLAVGSYALTAVASASGVTATSSVVNFSVVTPVTVKLTSPKIATNLFVFDYSANPGLSYVIQSSSNLFNWVTLATNVALTNPVHFKDGFTNPGRRYYRVSRVPNP